MSYKYRVNNILLFIYAILLNVFVAKSQIPTTWYFGQNAAVNFKATGGALSFGGSLMKTPAGCAVSDGGLYYSNGNKIWDKYGVITNKLKGDIQSSQSVLFVKPSKSNNHYIFTTDAGGGNDGLRYSELYSQNNSSSNNSVVLLPRVSEKLALTLNCNKTEYWILAHKWNSDEFYAYKMNDTMLETVPVVTAIGTVHSGSPANAAGYMKFSMFSDKVGLAITGKGIVELFHFDNINGTLSDCITLGGLSNPYGVEFDFDGSRFYVSTVYGKLYQYDISTWDSTYIAQSRILLASDLALFGALQLAYDHKIYLSRDNSPYLGVIKFPSQLGASCNYVPNGVFLGGKRCEAGLPPVHMHTEQFAVKGSKACIGDTTFFKILGDTTRIDSVFWDFGDSLSSNDTSTSLLPWYIYPKRYTYKFTLLIYHCNQTDTLRNFVEVLGPPFANLGPDTSVCDNDDFELFGGYAATYLWHDSTTSQKHIVNQPGKYWVRLTNKCGTSSDTVEILNVFNHPNAVLPADTVICGGDSILLTVTFDSTITILWNDTVPGDSFVVKDAGITTLMVVDSNGCKGKDDFVLGIDSVPEPDLGNDTTICIGQKITFNGNYPGNYLWNTGDMSASITTGKSGKYIVSVTNACGTVSDTVELTVDDCDQVIWVPSAFTPNGDGTNDIFIPYVENVYNYRLMVFDRWGNLIFETKNPDEGWDGRYKGRMSQTGAYVWKIIFSDYYGVEYKKYGFVVLLK